MLQYKSTVTYMRSDTHMGNCLSELSLIFSSPCLHFCLGRCCEDRQSGPLIDLEPVQLTGEAGLTAEEVIQRTCVENHPGHGAPQASGFAS